MAKVRILEDRVANQIAAGEVIERPAAVVKELLENALDAGATRVSVEFAHAGQALIRVEDNGHGMAAEDARLALQRHATSKIADAADLDRLGTFGFRGEALPSIASISLFTLRTRELGSDTGTEISVRAGKVLHERACGMPVGTRIDVERLFEPVPARRKFLKSDRTESAHIVETVRLYALACPATSFSLTEDARVVFRSPECPSLRDRVGEIFGGREGAEDLEIDVREEGMRLWGLLGQPGQSRSSRHDLRTFVNARPVDSRAFNGALFEAYREYLPPGRYPSAYLFLECPSPEVDVNVHPAKREVRFRNEARVRSFIIRSVLSRLRDEAALRAPAPAVWSAREPLELAPNIPAPFVMPRPQAPEEPAGESHRSEPAPAPVAPTAPAQRPLATRWRFLGVAHATHALFETDQGILLLDRRAAHERVWFERLKVQFESAGVPVQPLLLPLSLELPAIEAAILIDHLAFLRAHGFEVEEFGRNFFRVGALPAWMEPGDGEGFLRDLVAALREGRLPATKVDLAREELARLACQRAVRLPAALSEREALALVNDLFSTENPGVSPSGTATYVELSHSELARRFQK